jgi:holo-[acyl-carrier protein] synthase
VRVTVLGVGVDLVHVPSFADQLDQPGSDFAAVFTPGERRDANGRTTDAARHLAARWAAKEAVVKAWSASIYGTAPVMDDSAVDGGALRLIEVVTDAWGRPRIRLHGEVAKHLEGCTVEISLSHDGDYATAYAVLHRA